MPKQLRGSIQVDRLPDVATDDGKDYVQLGLRLSAAFAADLDDSYDANAAPVVRRWRWRPTPYQVEATGTPPAQEYAGDRFLAIPTFATALAKYEVDQNPNEEADHIWWALLKPADKEVKVAVYVHPSLLFSEMRADEKRKQRLIDPAVLL